VGKGRAKAFRVCYEGSQKNDRTSLMIHESYEVETLTGASFCEHFQDHSEEFLLYSVRDV